MFIKVNNLVNLNLKDFMVFILIKNYYFIQYFTFNLLIYWFVI